MFLKIEGWSACAAKVAFTRQWYGKATREEQSMNNHILNFINLLY